VKHQKKFSVRQARAFIERMSEDSNEGLADLNDEIKERKQAKGTAAATVGGDGQKRRLSFSDKSQSDSDDNDELDNDVEPNKRSDFMNRLTAKFRTITTKADVHSPVKRDVSGDQTVKNKLSLKMRSENAGGSRSFRQASGGEQTKSTGVQEKLSTVQASVEDWDRIDSFSDSDDEKQNVEPLKSGNRNDQLDDLDEIEVEEDDSEVYFSGVDGGSPAAECPKGSQKLTNAFWLTSPASKKSAYNTDGDDDDDDDEFVSNSSPRTVPFLVTQLCFGFFARGFCCCRL